jgi:hypothetical protein
VVTPQVEVEVKTGVALTTLIEVLTLVPFTLKLAVYVPALLYVTVWGPIPVAVAGLPPGKFQT